MSATNTAPTGGSFTKKQIDITITLGTGEFGQTGQNTVKLSNLRVIASINKSGMPSMDKCVLRVYGVQPSVMNAVSTLGVPLTMARHNNSVLVEAGDAVSGMAVVYAGYLSQAFQDFGEAPETALVITGWGGKDQAMFPATPISVAGSADVATLLQGIATRAGWGFTNSGVQVTLASCYFPGTAWEQIDAIKRAANIEAHVNSGMSPITLEIWPKYGTQGGLAPLISAKTGMIGYPKFQSNGMSFRTLFNPNIKLGGQIVMQSTVGAAANQPPPQSSATEGTQQGGPNGTWVVISPLSYDLSAQLPGGPWFCDVSCARPGTPAAQAG